MGDRTLSETLEDTVFEKKIVVIDTKRNLLGIITNKKTKDNVQKLYGHLNVIRVGSQSGLTSIRVAR